VTRPLGALAAALVLATPAFAGDGVPTAGLLSDAAFHRLVACGAPPGGECQSGLVAWPGPAVTIALHRGSGPVPGLAPDALSQAIDQAVVQVNGAGAALTLTRRPDDTLADIVIRPTAFREGQAVTGEVGMPDGTVIGVAQMNIMGNSKGQATLGVILIAADMTTRDLRSVVLEEIVQTLGLPWDIENPAYEGRSIFAQDTNSVITLAGQDAAVLRLHYPSE
jgi:hypothetical protein